MLAMKRVWAGTRAAAAVLLLSACGGGGGGGPAEAPNQQAPNVTLRSSGGLFAANVTVGSVLPAQMVSGTASGDATTLGGRTVYLVVDDSAGLFAPSGHTVSLDATTGNFFVTLQGRAITFAGRRTGTFQIRACLDAQCSTQLNGSPLSYPFEIVSAEPLAVSSSSLRLSSKFGEGTAVSTQLNSSFPPNANVAFTRRPIYAGSLDQTFGFEHTLIGFGGTLNAAAGAHSGVVQARPAGPGIYYADIQIVASVPGKQSLPFEQTQTVRVEYEVVDDPAVVAAFHPQSVLVDATGFGCQEDPPIRVLPLLRSGDQIEVARFEYISEPGAAAAHPFSRNWLEAFPPSTVPRIRSCVGGQGPLGTDSVPLPPGVYEARVVYRVTTATGSSREVKLAVRYLR